MLELRKIEVDLPVDTLHLIGLNGKEKLNVHAELKLDFLLSSEQDLNYLLEKNFGDEVITIKMEKEILFRGLFKELDFSIDGDVMHTSLQLESTTKKFDFKKKRRTFQDPAQTATTILNQLFIPNEEFITTVDFKPNHVTYLQWDETDWSFAKRLVRSQGSFLVADPVGKEGRFWVGAKKGRNISEEIIKQQQQVDFKRVHDFTENFKEANILYKKMSFKSTESYEIGDYLMDAGTKFLVVEKEYRTNGEIIEFYYDLIEEKRISHLPNRPFYQKNLSIDGKVIDVRGNRLKVHFDIDKEQGIDTASWIECSEEYRNIAYFMPEIGSKVKVMFSRDATQAPVVISNLRENISYENDMQDTETKIIQNVNQKRFTLSRQTLSITNEGVSIVLTDDQSIAVSSSGDISMSGANAINVSSSNNISITGRSTVIARSSACSIMLGTRVDMFGSRISHTSGGVGKAVHAAFEGKRNNKSSKRKVTTPQLMDRNTIANQFLNMVPMVEEPVVQKMEALIPRIDQLSILSEGLSSQLNHTMESFEEVKKGFIASSFRPSLNKNARNRKVGIEVPNVFITEKNGQVNDRGGQDNGRI